MRKNKNTSKIILGLLVFILATSIAYSGFKNMNSQLEERNKLIELMQNSRPKPQGDYAYAIAKNNLKAGEIIADEDVDFKGFDTINTNAFDNRSNVVNKILLKDITSGDMFTTSHIAQISKDDVTLKPGFRALTLPSDGFQGRSDIMKVGSFVDIYSMATDSDWAYEKVKIIGIENTNAPPNSPEPMITKSTSITFEVPVSSISDFISNVAKGKLVLVARNQNDKTIHKRPKPASSETYPSLPNLPASVPISNFSGLPQPIQPMSQSSSVEVIEANVKSQVTFD